MTTVAEREPSTSGIQLFARTLVIYFAFFLWTFFGIIWVFMFIRVMSAYGWALVRHVFTGQQPPDEARLDYVALFWVKGFADISDAFSRKEVRSPVFPRPEVDPWEEFWIACLLFVWMLISYSTFGYVAGVVGSLANGLWQGLVIIGGFLFNLVRAAPGVSV